MTTNAKKHFKLLKERQPRNFLTKKEEIEINEIELNKKIKNIDVLTTDLDDKIENSDIYDIETIYEALSLIDFEPKHKKL